jgi:sulfate transport system substrate-binding protein
VKSIVSRVARAAVVLALVAGAPLAFAQQQVLLNASYDVAREFYKDYDALFVKSWKDKTGQSVTINQSHDGSSKQARAVADGLEADVVTMNTANDIDFLASRGIVPLDWAKRFPNNASPTYSTMLFLVRKGNPKGIKDWDDLAKPGVQVVVVNPKTGGNGRYSYMGAWGWAKKKGMSDADAAAFVGRIFRNVPVLDTGGRGATTTFLQRNIGDVLVTFESEVVQVDREFGAGKVDAVYPSVSVLAENPVAVIDRVVQKKGTTALAKAYLDGLYADDAQEIAAKHYLRVRSAKVMAAHAAEFKPITLFTVDEMFGSWKDAQAKHFNDGGQFDQIMAGIGKR